MFRSRDKVIQGEETEIPIPMFDKNVVILEDTEIPIYIFRSGCSLTRRDRYTYLHI